MDAASIDAVLELGLTAAAALLAGSGAALGWVAYASRRRAAREHARALTEAEAKKREATDALAHASREYAALRDAVRAQTDAEVEAQRRAVVAAFAPVQQALDALVKDAPASHVLTPGLTLVARQLEGVLAEARRSGGAGEVFEEEVAREPGDLLERAGLGEEVGGAGDHDE